MLIGNRLKEVRRAAGMTQKALGVELNLTKNTIARLERNERVPRLKTLIKIAGFFGVPVSLFFMTNKKLRKIRNEQKQKPHKAAKEKNKKH